MCDKNFPSLVASLFSWRYLAASTSYFPRGHKPPPTLRDHLKPHLASNAVAFRSLAMPNARMSLCTQSVHSFAFPSRPLCTSPSRFSKHDSLWQPPAAHSDERPRPQKFSRAQHYLNALAPGYLKGTIVRAHPMVCSLALCPVDAKQDPVVYGAEFGVVFLAKGPYIASI